MSSHTNINENDIEKLLSCFKNKAYEAKDDVEGSYLREVMDKCKDLFALDYQTVEITNTGGVLSSQYPAVIIIPEFEKDKASNLVTKNGTQSPFNQNQSNASVSTNISSSQRTQQPTIYEKSYEKVKLKELISKARYARARTRFPAPVILYKGKFLCRSSTLSSTAEIYTRIFLDKASGVTESTTDSDEASNDDVVEARENLTEQEDENDKNGANGTTDNGKSDWALCERFRSNDIKLLEALNVKSIIDLMVENKKVKFGLRVSSSEKVDKESRYRDFNLICLPYPGCEFFREFKKNGWVHKSLIFDWSQEYIDAEIVVPPDMAIDIKWDEYKTWNLTEITQNYLKLSLKYLQDSDSGLLIHCISGWDRTPLFVSLIRLSLWADGAIHQSLNAEQIFYLTIAYDWFLFGHNLPDRLNKREAILYFCYQGLKDIYGQEFAVSNHKHRTKQNSNTSHNSSGSCSSSHYSSGSSNHDDLQFPFEETRSISRSSGGSQLEIKHRNLDDIQETTNGILTNLPNDGSNSGIDEAIEYIHSPNSKRNDSIASIEERAIGNNHSPNSNRKTSPVQVPLKSRQRNESTSSTDSYQFVNDCGSLNSTYSHLRTNPSLQDSNATVTNDEPTIITPRMERLDAVRKIFFKCYRSAIGIPYDPEETEQTFKQQVKGIVYNMASRIGL